MPPPTLLSVPNVSEGRSQRTIEAIAAAFAPRQDRPPAPRSDAPTAPPPEVRLLDVHSDADHHRSVFTLSGPQGTLAEALLAGARVAAERIDVMHRLDEGAAGQHPHVGAIDVVPLVYLDPQARGAACAEALVVAELLAEELRLPVFLYGELTADDSHPPRSRAELRRGGVHNLARRMAAEDQARGAATRGTALGARGSSARGLRPDFGPPLMHPTAGATLVAARPPLVAFNLQLAPPGTLEDARAIAALIREGGREGLPGLRAIGVSLGGGVAQVSMNVERPFDLSLAAVVEAVRRHAELAGAELVGLAPAVAFEGFPEDLPMPGFDPARHLIENALGSE
jgi:glutamate formiminotransferase/glutamate formiminotransferase/formiminotetrahydrofolate cyclodeaminase